MAWFLASTGAPLDTTISTNPGQDMFDTGFAGLSWAAAKVVPAGFAWGVPIDYDQELDWCRLRLLAKMAGSTDTATALDATLYEDADATTDLDPTISADLTTTLTWVEINADGNSLSYGKALMWGVFPEAHGTDAVQVYAAAMAYKSTIVPAVKTDRGS